jgi:hypothetical protein
MSENQQEKTFIDTGFFKWNGEFSLLSTIAVIIYLSALVTGDISWWTLPLIIIYKMDFITVDVAKFFPKKNASKE